LKNLKLLEITNQKEIKFKKSSKAAGIKPLATDSSYDSRNNQIYLWN